MTFSEIISEISEKHVDLKKVSAIMGDSMKQKPTIAERIKGLKKSGDGFVVATRKDRVEAYAAIHTLRGLNQLPRPVKTTPCEKGFRIYAV